MEIQQHDGVVVEATVISAGLRQALGDGGVSREGEGEARGLGAHVRFCSNFKKIPTHTQDHVMHSNERGECCLRTHVDRLRKR